jgi:hypothetical protein
MRELVRTSRYVATTHAVEEMEADGLTIFDVEHSILTGRIVKRQRDRLTRNNKKYVIEGRSLGDENVGVVVKISPTRKLVIVTVYLL